jgi:hypothetical protein
MSKTKGEYLHLQQVRRRSYGDGRLWSGGAVFGATFAGMQGFTCVKRRLRGICVHDDLFIRATLALDTAHYFFYIGYIGPR